MSQYTVHSIPGSPYGRAVLIALEEKGATYRIAPVTPGAHKSPEHLRRNPFGRIPVLQEDDFLLYETQAIIRFLDRAHSTSPLTPTDHRTAARMDQLMNVNDWYLFQGVVNIIAFQRLIAPRVLALAPDEAVIAAAMPRAHFVVDELANQLGDQPYFAGPSFSLADVLLAPQLDMLRSTPEWEALTRNHKPLQEWLHRVDQRPSMSATTWERVVAMAKAA